MDNLFGNADVGLVGIGIFKCKGIREVGIEQDTPPILDDKEAALAEPPDATAIGIDDALNIGEESVVLLESGFHLTIPSSRRTIRTPSTIFLSFCLAAQRAVWLRP